MNRDRPPTGADIALATGELMVTARRTVAALPPATSPADAVAAVREAIARTLWPKVTPEAARDVMVAAAQLACEHSAGQLPADVTGRYGDRDLDGAIGMLELTGEWISDGRPGPVNGPFTPPLAFASSVAFDRDEDDQTLTSLSALLAVAHLALRDRGGRHDVIVASCCDDCLAQIPRSGNWAPGRHMAIIHASHAPALVALGWVITADPDGGGSPDIACRHYYDEHWGEQS